jgi:hypothetical protein
MAETGVIATQGALRPGAGWLTSFARQRELSLVAIMVVLGALVSIAAPQFLTDLEPQPGRGPRVDHAVAAVGEALVVITRNVDLSVEAMIGLVAYCVASILELPRSRCAGAIVLGIGIGLVLGMINGVIVTLLRVPSIVATLGTLSIFRGVDYLIAGSHQVPLAALRTRLHRSGARQRSWASRSSSHRARDRGHRDRRPALDPLRAAGLRRRQQPGGGGDPRHPVAARGVRGVLGCAACSPASPASCG